MKQKIIIMDIDGCLADHKEHQLKYFGEGKKDYYGFEKEMPTLKVNDYMKIINNNFWYDLDYKLIILTGRKNKSTVRRVTDFWLKSNAIGYDELILKEPYDIKSSEFKKQVVVELMKENEIALAIDDSPAIIEIYNSLGIPTLKARSNYEILGDVE